MTIWVLELTMMLLASGVPQCYTVQMEVGMKTLKYRPLQIEYLVKKKLLLLFLLLSRSFDKRMSYSSQLKCLVKTYVSAIISYYP